MAMKATSAGASCVANLAALQGAKETWAREHKKGPTDVPQPSDLIGPDKYLRAKPVCSLGGTYRLGSVREKPTCKIVSPGHTLDIYR